MTVCCLFHFLVQDQDRRSYENQYRLILPDIVAEYFEKRTLFLQLDSPILLFKDSALISNILILKFFKFFIHNFIPENQWVLGFLHAQQTKLKVPPTMKLSQKDQFKNCHQNIFSNSDHTFKIRKTKFPLTDTLQPFHICYFSQDRTSTSLQELKILISIPYLATNQRSAQQSFNHCSQTTQNNAAIFWARKSYMFKISYNPTM